MPPLECGRQTAFWRMCSVYPNGEVMHDDLEICFDASAYDKSKHAIKVGCQAYDGKRHIESIIAGFCRMSRCCAGCNILMLCVQMMRTRLRLPAQPSPTQTCPGPACRVRSNPNPPMGAETTTLPTPSLGYPAEATSVECMQMM